MSVLVDTPIACCAEPNLLIPQHAVSMRSVARLLAGGEPVCFTPQNISRLVAAMNAHGVGLSYPLIILRAKMQPPIGVSIASPVTRVRAP
jgi:hypothetical protein